MSKIEKTELAWDPSPIFSNVNSLFMRVALSRFERLATSELGLDPFRCVELVKGSDSDGAVDANVAYKIFFTTPVDWTSQEWPLAHIARRCHLQLGPPNCPMEVFICAECRVEKGAVFLDQLKESPRRQFLEGFQAWCRAQEGRANDVVMAGVNKKIGCDTDAYCLYFSVPGRGQEQVAEDADKYCSVGVCTSYIRDWVLVGRLPSPSMCRPPTAASPKIAQNTAPTETATAPTPTTAPATAPTATTAPPAPMSVEMAELKSLYLARVNKDFSDQLAQMNWGMIKTSIFTRLKLLASLGLKGADATLSFPKPGSTFIHLVIGGETVAVFTADKGECKTMCADAIFTRVHTTFPFSNLQARSWVWAE